MTKTLREGLQASESSRTMDKQLESTQLLHTEEVFKIYRKTARLGIHGQDGVPSRRITWLARLEMNYKCRQYRQESLSSWRQVNSVKPMQYSSFTDTRLLKFQRVKWRCQQVYKRPACPEMTDKCQEHPQESLNSGRRVYSVKPVKYSRFTDARLTGFQR